MRDLCEEEVKLLRRVMEENTYGGLMVKPENFLLAANLYAEKLIAFSEPSDPDFACALAIDLTKRGRLAWHSHEAKRLTAEIEAESANETPQAG